MVKDDTFNSAEAMLGAIFPKKKIIAKGTKGVKGNIPAERVAQVILLVSNTIREETYKCIHKAILDCRNADNTTDWNKVNDIIDKWMKEQKAHDEVRARNIIRIQNAVDEVGEENVIILVNNDNE